MLDSSAGLTDAVNVGEVAPFVCIQCMHICFHTIPLSAMNSPEGAASFIRGAASFQMWNRNTDLNICVLSTACLKFLSFFLVVSLSKVNFICNAY